MPRLLNFASARRLLAGAAVAVGLASAMASLAEAQAPSPTTDDIVKALKTNRGVSRGLSAPSVGGPPGAGAAPPSALPPGASSAPALEQKVIEEARTKSLRGLSVSERTQLANIALSKPGIDLEIYFDFNSAQLTAKAMPTLVALGMALKNGELQGATFLLGGHTDAKGAASYNQALSDKRAKAVQAFLAERFGIPATKLIAVGYGKEQLKNKANPLADENRRVQVVNLGK